MKPPRNSRYLLPSTAVGDSKLVTSRSPASSSCSTREPNWRVPAIVTCESLPGANATSYLLSLWGVSAGSGPGPGHDLHVQRRRADVGQQPAPGRGADHLDRAVRVEPEGRLGSGGCQRVLRAGRRPGHREWPE